MSADTMAAHDDGLDEAKAIVRKYLTVDCGEGDCRICEVIKKRRSRILAALQRAKEQSR